MPTADNKLICLHPLALFPCTYIDSSRSIVEKHKLLGVGMSETVFLKRQQGLSHTYRRCFLKEGP
jgi:hypothetical protein